MSQELHLELQERSASGKSVRLSGYTPGVMYGQGQAAVSVQVPAAKLKKLYHEAGTNKLIQVAIGSQPTHNVLFHDVQINPLTSSILHFDLYTVKMDEKIKTEVPLHFVNDSPAVYTHSAVLLKNLEAVEVEALPAKLPEYIEVDLEKLKEIGDDIFVRDLVVPADVTILAEPEELVVKADPPRSEEELEELEAPPEAEVAEVESEHGGAKEEAETEAAEPEAKEKGSKTEE